MILFLIIILICLTIYLGYGAISENLKANKLVNEINDLKNGIIEIIGKLKPKQSIIIHYGNGKQLTFIKGELQ